MNQLLRKMSIVLLVTLLSANTARATEPQFGAAPANPAATPCESVLAKCDKALEAKNKEIKLCQLGLQNALDRSMEQDAVITEKNRQLESVFRNPFIMMALGAVVGILVVK